MLLVGLGNCFDSTYHSVEVLSVPTVDLGPDTNDCLRPIVPDAGTGFSSYLWHDQSTGHTLAGTTTGTYSVIVTDANGCTASDDMEFEACLGLEELADEVYVFPNPMTSHAYISLENLDGNMDLQLTDFKGKTISNQRITSTGLIEVDMEELPSGIYYIHLNSNSFSKVFKILKE